jgi:hypothetical protein
MSHTPLSTSETALLGTLLGTVAEQFAHKSCTDYTLEASAANKAIVAAAIEQAGTSGDWGDDDASWQDYVAQVMDADDAVTTFMDWMAGHLAARCRSRVPLNGAELSIVAEMLGVALEDHEEAEALGLVPYAMQESAENRDILALISDVESRPPEQETSVPFQAVLMYYIERCIGAAESA